MAYTVISEFSAYCFCIRPYQAAQCRSIARPLRPGIFVFVSYTPDRNAGAAVYDVNTKIPGDIWTYLEPYSNHCQ